MFLSRNASTADRSPWGQFWFEPVGMRTDAGGRVTPSSAMRLSAVYSCVRVLAETFAVLPFRLYRKRTDGRRGHGELVTDHWLYRLLALRPNNWQTPFEWREMMQGHLALRGNAFNQMVFNGAGEVTSLIPLHPDRVRAERFTNGDYRFRVGQLDGTELVLSRNQMWHIRGMSSDGVVGLNPIEVAAEVFGLGQAAQSYGARFFANDAKPGGWLEMVGKFADNVAKQTFAEGWRAAHSGANRGKTAILENGMKYHELTLNNSDAQFLESRKFSRSEIASLFRIPPHMIGDLEKATFSNIEQQSLDFVIGTMTPWAERWESSIESFLMLDGDADLEVEFDFSNLLRGDSAARALYYTKMFQLGALSPNDIRDREGEQPITGGDKYFVPLNMVPLEQAGQAALAKKQKAAALPAPGAPADDGADARRGVAPVALVAPTVAPVAMLPAAHDTTRFLAVIRAAAERVARKELQLVKAAFRTEDPESSVRSLYVAHANFVASCLGVTQDAAESYCNGRAALSRSMKGMEEADFLAIATSNLEYLALKGQP